MLPPATKTFDPPLPMPPPSPAPPPVREALGVVVAWEALDRCEDEFGSRFEFCGEYADHLDSAIAGLAAALGRAA